MLKGNNNITYKVMHFTTIGPAKDMLDIEEIPTIVRMDNKGTTNELFDKMSSDISRLVYKALLSHYTHSRKTIYGNGRKFKSLFAILCDQFDIE